MNDTEIPLYITDEEEVIRVLLNPIHINEKDEIKPYAFQPPADSQDISVNRRHYTTFALCKKQGLALQNEKNTFFGLGIVLVKKVRELEFNVKYTPTLDNTAHCDIQLGALKQKGEPLPTNITLKIKLLIKEVFLHKYSDMEI